MASSMDLDLNTIWIMLATLGGAVAGSVIHAISLRLPAHVDPVGPAICHVCHEPLPWKAFVPFLPVVCPQCGAQTNWHKAATEASAAVFVALSLLSHGLTLYGLSVALFSLVLLQVLRIDWQHHLIYTIVIVPGSVLALFLAVLDSQSALVSAIVAAVGAALVFAFFYALALAIYKRRALGRGDILLAFLIGAMAGIDLVVAALLLGMLLGALGGLFLIGIGKRTRHDYIPYGAYLCAGAIIVLLLPA
jgi:leader peptidase (prepilin peptidase) / N-methyltransferase